MEWGSRLGLGLVDMESEVLLRVNTDQICSGVSRLASGWVDLESEV